MKPFAAVVLTCVAQAIKNGYTPDYSFYGITVPQKSGPTTPAVQSSYDPYAYYGIDSDDDHHEIAASIKSAEKAVDDGYDPYVKYGIKSTSKPKLTPTKELTVTAISATEPRETFEER